MDLNQIETQFMTFAERLPQLVWATQADGTYIFFNQRWYDFTGLSQAESTGKGWLSAVPEEDRTVIEAKWRQALATGGTYEAEHRLRSGQGQVCWVLSRGLPERDQAGRVTRWFGTCTVIDAQKRAETSLRALDEQYRLALDAAKLGTWRIELDTGMVHWDEGSCNMFQLPPDPMRTMPLSEAMQSVHPDDRRMVEEKIAQAVAPGSNGLYDVEYRTLLGDGSVRWTHSTGRVFFNEAGRIEGLSGVVGDITDRRAMTEAQELLTRELTHRVKNLFAIANGMVSMTARTAKDTKEMATALRGRLGALARAHELAQPTASGAASGLGKLVEAVLAPYSLEKGRIDITGPDVTIGANTTTSLALVLHEFATNAAKYGCLSNSGGHLHVSWRQEGDKVSLIWDEAGGPAIGSEPSFQGFGSQLAQRSIIGQLAGTLDREWREGGLLVRMTLPVDRLSL